MSVRMLTIKLTEAEAAALWTLALNAGPWENNKGSMSSAEFRAGQKAVIKLEDAVLA